MGYLSPPTYIGHSLDVRHALRVFCDGVSDVLGAHRLGLCCALIMRAQS